MMNRCTTHLLTATLLCLALSMTATGQSVGKWSRQLEPSVPGTEGVADNFDWIPLAQPVDTSVGSAASSDAGNTKDRSANGRVLTYSQTFPPDAHFGNLPPPPSTKSHFAQQQQQQLQHQHQPQAFDFPYQFQRFLNAPPQTQSLRAGGPLKAPQEPTSQSFFKFEMPLHGEANRQISGAPSVQTGYQIQHSFGGAGGSQSAALFNQALYSQQPVFPPEFHPLPQKSLSLSSLDQQKPLAQQNYIDDSLPPLKNSFRDSKPPHPTQQAALQAVAPQVFPVEPPVEAAFELNKPTSFQNQPTYQQTGPASTAAANAAAQQQQDVQLLYVPYDTLYNQQQQQQAGGAPTATPATYDVNKYNVNSGLPAVNPYQINQFYTPDPVAQPDAGFYTTSTTTNRPPHTTSLKPDLFHQSFLSSPQPQFTTAKPKPKAHQPPLAMFMLRSSSRPTQSDVVATLRNANTISVIDAPTKQTPSIFVGPAGMPVPDGYVKFDLPYLSQLSQKRDLREVPFFVAPLSYRTPGGFNKILLPEPHVGSIVVNRANEFDGSSQSAAPTQSLDINQQYASTAIPQARPTQQQRIKQNPLSNNKDYYSSSDIVRQQPTQKLRDPFEITTQRATLPTNRGNKFNYYYDQDQVIHEVTSPKISKLDRPKKKRPQSVQIEQYQPQQQQINQNSNTYAHYKPAPNQISTEEYYKVPQTKPATTSTSTSTTSTTTSTTSTTAAPQTYFTYNTSPQLEFQSTKGQLYPNLNGASQATADEHIPQPPRFTTRPPALTTEEEEYRMKQYFRQQNAFRNRPQLVPSTLSPYEQVQYTPVALDFDHEVKIPSSTTQKATTSTAAKQRFTFYTPTPTPVTVTTLDQQQINTVTPQYNEVSAVPANHRPAFNQNEISDDITEYEPNPYQLPSELPPLTPNLPGLINNLQDKDKLNAIGFESSTAASTTLEPEQSTRPSRRPTINRVRKPVVSKITSSVSYSESESTSRRPQRVRRPLPSRGYTSDSESITTSTSTTRRPTSPRTNIIRNPNRIRYQPTPEERQSLRIKTRKYTSGSKKATASEDLEYQRDVLKQNYPVFKPHRKATSPTAIPSSYSTSIGTEVPTSESQQVYTVTPSNSISNDPDRFPASLLEPMQIAEQYNEYTKDNYGPGYFPNQEDLAPTEPALRNEISPYSPQLQSTTTTATTTTTTTTTPAPTTAEEPAITTRRSPFVRRNYPRLRTTTTEATTTTQAPEEKSSIRPRIPPRKVIKVRQRTRRPYQSSTTTTTSSTPEDEQEEQEPRQTFRKVNRYNQDLYENDSARRRLKNKSHFQLEGQESQWSPALKTANSHNFKPFNPKDKSNKDDHKALENEPEIVTAGPPTLQGAQESNGDNYEINVSANLGSSQVESSQKTIKAPNLKPEKSFAELLEEVMGKAPEEEPLEMPLETETRTTDGTFFESHKTTIGDRFNRRGKWKKLRAGGTTPSGGSESFETAESQNLGSQLYNALYSGINKNGRTSTSTTPLTPTDKESTTTTSSPFYTTTTAPTPLSTIDDYDMTTSRHMELTTLPTSIPTGDEDDMVVSTTTASNLQSDDDAIAEMATRRHDIEAYDDLDTQSSLFSEVKKQLHDLFAIEENENENERAVTAALAAVGRRRQEYTNIKRAKVEEAPATTTDSADASFATATTTATPTDSPKSPFHKNLMDHVVYATSTSTKVTSETEICYRGRCVRSEDLPPNHKLN